RIPCSHRIGVLSSTVLILALSACGSDTGSGPEDVEPEQYQVNADGGTIVAQGGGVSLTIPPGAVASSRTITVEPASNPSTDPDFVPGTLYEFGPDGLQFVEPVTLQLTYDPTAIPGVAPPQRLRVFKRVGTTWLPTSNPSVDVTNRTVTGEIDSFSEYGLVVAPFEPLAVTTTEVPNAVQHVDYWEVTYGEPYMPGGRPGDPHLLAQGGNGFYTWTVAAGALPTGMTLHPEGDLIGTPTELGSESVTFEVRSGDGQVDRRVLAVTVAPRPVLAPAELCTDYPGYAVATFADSALDAAIRLEVGLAPGEVPSCSEAASYTALMDVGGGISSLVGLQNLRGLNRLELRESSIADISPLAGMGELAVLILASNQVTDLSPLSEIPSLFAVDVDDNRVTDLQPLSGLTNLTNLEVARNSISDLSPLSGLTGLRSLRAEGNSIIDVAPLSGLTELISLVLEDNSIFSIQPLEGLTKLQSLWLRNNRITSISWLSDLVDLEQLYLGGNSIGGGTVFAGGFRSSLSAVRFMPKLRDLKLNDNALGGVDGVSNFQPILLSGIGIGPGIRGVDLRNTGVNCSVVTSLENLGVTVYNSTCGE
ncbi:MAG: leucine-rich repeat domain-containing protein, partial [Longimicrobiales bacterium]|nr:leucine-rich repeat domain-containing protein [Longimicrobiales bacterium]